MRRITSILMLLACTTLLPVASMAAWWGSDDSLVTIDGTRYTTEDFKRWWGFWNDEGLDLPKTPEPYIDWILLSREGERMELHGDPNFQRKVKVFLQVRSLLMLKREEIDGRIAITDEDIRARYEKLYTPRWLVQRLQFRDEAAAAAAWQGLAEGSSTVEGLLELDAEDGGPESENETWLRPVVIDPGWAAIFGKLAVGEVVDPSEHQGGSVLYLLKEQKGGDDEDFAQLQELLRRKIWKEQEGELTTKLLTTLREKYEVRVDEERLAALVLNAPDDTFTDEVIISTNRQNVTEREFIEIARRDMKFQPHASLDGEEAKKIKERVANGIIDQSVTNWDSMERSYQEKEPFKWEFDFHVRHQLTKALEEKLFAPGDKVTEDEIKQHYEANLARYSQPEMVKVAFVEDAEGSADRIWRGVMTGTEFFKAVREHAGQDIYPQEVPVEHLDPAIGGVVAKLAKGETSQPFNSQGSQVIVHLVDRSPKKPIPFAQVASAIRTVLEEEKIAQERAGYMALLKSRSKINVKERNWKAVVKELGGVK